MTGSSPSPAATKCCCRCKAVKPIYGFNVRNALNGRRQTACRECQNRYSQEHYRKNRTDYRTRALKRRKEIFVFVKSLKAKPCTDCGESYPHYVMDFDHREPGCKEFNVSRAMVRGVAMETILAEAAKCDVVCANCHRERTFGHKLV